jgi:lipid II:glycine glycyltransferase (peptidoglycan interpeptide bridge formation enzyme)
VVQGPGDGEIIGPHAAHPGPPPRVDNQGAASRVRVATPAEIDRWDELVKANPDRGNMLQTRVWGEFKRAWWWRPVYLFEDDPADRVATLFLRRRVRGLGWLWYAPKGPGVTSAEQLRRLLADRHLFTDAFCIQVESEAPDTADNRAALVAMGLRKAADVQVSRATIVVDIVPDEAAILSSFKPKTRYNIRLAGRRGVTVDPVPCTEINVEVLHGLMARAFERAGIPLRPLTYFADYWRLFEASGQGQLFLAQRDGEVLAGAYVVFLGEKAWYKDGGSVGDRGELMAPHLLQWEVMRWLRAHGVRSYDLFAVPRSDQEADDSPLHGLWQFKSGFSTDVRQFVGTWDLVLDERRYRLWRRIGEPVMRRVRWRLHGDLFY